MRDVSCVTHDYSNSGYTDITGHPIHAAIAGFRRVRSGMREALFVRSTHRGMGMTSFLDCVRDTLTAEGATAFYCDCSPTHPSDDRAVLNSTEGVTGSPVPFSAFHTSDWRQMIMATENMPKDWMASVRSALGSYAGCVAHFFPEMKDILTADRRGAALRGSFDLPVPSRFVSFFAIHFFSHSFINRVSSSTSRMDD